MDTYFAAEPTEDIGKILQGKVDRYYAYLTSSSLVDLWRKSFYAYYGLLPDTAVAGFGIFAIGSITARGAEGELACIKVNHLRNLITHQLAMTTQSRPALECRACNSDSKSLAQAYLGDGILDYFVREKKIEKQFRNATELALVLGEGFNRYDWDATAGKEYGVGPNGGVIHDGDLVVKTYNPFDVIRDTAATSPDTLSWWICHDTANRYDLAAKHPDIADQILSCTTDITSARRFIDPTKVIPAAGIGARDSELIDIYEFLHKPTDAMPQGRYTIFLNGGLVLFDGPLPFRKVPLHRISAANVIGSPFGWTLAFDLLGIQELVDKLYSVVASNQLASGVQNFWQPPGNQLSKTQIAGGLNLLESVVKPEVLQMCSTPPEVFSFIDKLERIMETLSGISAVNRGATPENLKSGSALAFVAAQAVTFQSDLQASYNQLLEGGGQSMIEILKDFAATPRMAVISGSFNRPLMKTFVGGDLDKIDRVVVDATNSVSKTTAGKIQIAQDLLNAGQIRNAKEYLTVVNTGELEALFESEMSEILLIRHENEDLRSGVYPQALLCDDHITHVREHRAVIANPESRRDPQIVGDAAPGRRSGVLGHIQDHIEQAQQRTPQLLAMLGEQPLPSPQQTPAGPGNLPQQKDATPPNQQKAAEVKQPNMPSMPAGAPQATQEAYSQMKQDAQ